MWSGAEGRRQDKTAEQAYYDRYGAEFEEAFSDELYERWFRLCGLWDAPAKTILEAACGAGHFGRRLAARGHRVTGVDLSPVVVCLANERSTSGFHAVVGDLEQAALFPPRQFDVVFFGQALHHFPDPGGVLENCARWLQPGGWLVLIEPNGSNPVNAMGKAVGNLLALHPAMRKAIGTVNEVSLPVGRTIRALQRQGFAIELEFMEAILPRAQSLHEPAALRALGVFRRLLYLACLKLLPPRFSGVQFILVARAARA